MISEDEIMREPYNSSVDAALTLVKPEWHLSIEYEGDCFAGAKLSRGVASTYRSAYSGTQKTLPVAICVAVLRMSEVDERHIRASDAYDKALRDESDFVHTQHYA